MRHVVIDGNCFFISVESNHVQDRHEKLFLQDWSICINLDDSWHHVVTLGSFNYGASIENLAALALGLGNAILESFHLGLGLKWTN